MLAENARSTPTDGMDRVDRTNDWIVRRDREPFNILSYDTISFCKIVLFDGLTAFSSRDVQTRPFFLIDAVLQDEKSFHNANDWGRH